MRTKIRDLGDLILKVLIAVMMLTTCTGVSFAVGQPGVTADDLYFEIRSAVFLEEDAWRTAPEGKQYLYIEVYTENHRRESVGMTAITMCKLTDAQGNQYSVVLPEDEGSLNGIIAKWDHMTGYVAFLVPKSQDNFTLTINPTPVVRNNVSYQSSATFDIDRYKDQVYVGSAEVEINAASPTGGGSVKLRDIHELTAPLQIDQMSYKIESIELSDEDPYIELQDGFKALNITVRMVNYSQIRENINTDTYFHLEDSQGQICPMLIKDMSQSLDGYIEKGAVKRGVLRYMVPDGEGYVLNIHPDMSGPVNVEIDLTY